MFNEVKLSGHGSLRLSGELPIEEAGNFLLPPEVRANLRRGKPIHSNHIDGRLVPYLYSDDWISAVAGYCIAKPTYHSSQPYRENFNQYIDTFHLPRHIGVAQKKIPESDIPHLYKRGFINDIFITVHDIKPPERGRIWMQGRFNGPLHPAIIETVLRIKQEFPDYEFYVGIDHDESSIEQGQAPFMDVQFRATLLYRTGLFDKIVLLEPPGRSYTAEERDDWWEDFYAISGRLDPHRVVSSENVWVDKHRAEQISTRTKLLFPDSLPREVDSGMHQSQLRAGTISVEEVRRGWDVVRRLLGAPRQT